MWNLQLFQDETVEVVFVLLLKTVEFWKNFETPVWIQQLGEHL